MANTPDVIISKPSLYLKRALAGIGLFYLFVGIVHFAAGNNGLLQLVIAGVFLWLSSKVKYKWVKQFQVDGYKRV